MVYSGPPAAIGYKNASMKLRRYEKQYLGEQGYSLAWRRRLEGVFFLFFFFSPSYISKSMHASEGHLTYSKEGSV